MIVVAKSDSCVVDTLGTDALTGSDTALAVDVVKIADTLTRSPDGDLSPSVYAISLYSRSTLLDDSFVGTWNHLDLPLPSPKAIS